MPGKMDLGLLNTVSIVSLLAVAGLALASLAATKVFGRKCSRGDKLVLFWLFWDVAIHFSLEGPFVILSLLGTVEKSNHWTALLWKEYGKADKRWLVSDPTIVSLEILTVFFDGFLCLILIFAICKNKFYRHWIQIVLCVCELYGGWMTFAPEWLTGSRNLVTDNWLFLWVYLIFFNGLWVVIPLALLYQSWVAMKDCFPGRVPPSKNVKNLSAKAENMTSPKSGPRKQKAKSKKAQ